MRPWPFGDATENEKITLNPSHENLIMADNILNKYAIEGDFISSIRAAAGKSKWVPPRILANKVRRHADETAQRPFVIEGPADSVACEVFQRLLGDTIPVIMGITPKVLSALLSKSSAYFGGDSGVSHLASLFAPRSTILYGPDSDIRVWRPIGSGTLCNPWETI